MIGTWENYHFIEIRTDPGQEPEKTKDFVYTELLITLTFKADGTAVTRQYDEDTEEWEETSYTYEAKDGKIKLIEEGIDEDDLSGHHIDGTYELTKDELVMMQTVIDGEGDEAIKFDYTEKYKRIK